jgi:ubiquinone/menaquinone biosynthesis C-methylase UbiE
MPLIDAARDKQVWNSDKVTKVYATVDKLQKPEQAILDMLKDRLPKMRMLDLGVGGGRTTVHFAPLVAEYVGSDYAENMVDACRERFPDAGDNVSFEVIDATDMNELPSDYFDFILFSFNSIDCVAPEDREKVFAEAIRVGKKGGYFAFSTHNLRYLPWMYRLKWHKRWQDFAYQFYRSFMLIYYNGLPGKYKNNDYAVIRNGIEHFSLNIFYVNPEYQIERLKKAGFKNIRTFSIKTGAEVPHSRLSALTREAWIYYLCEI